MRGATGPPRIALDLERISFIQTTCLSYVQGDENEKARMWNKCKNAMSKKLAEYRRKGKIDD